MLCMCMCVLPVMSFQVSLELTSEDQCLLNYFGGSIEGVSLQLCQDSDSLHCHLDLGSVSLMDSSINDRGRCVCMCVSV